MEKKRLSVIVPFFNEEENLERLHKELVSVLEKLGQESEIVYVDDGSTDSSRERLLNLVQKKKNGIKIKLVSFNRNFGQTAAVVAGIDQSSGEIISFLDADLQNDPHDIPLFLTKMKEGYDAVFGWRKKRKDATLRSFLSRSANKIINLVFSYPYHDVGCSARVVKREFLKDLQLYGELHRIMPVLIYLKGAKIGEIEVSHRYRVAGKSKYGFERIAKTLIDIISVKFLTAYGTKPAYIFGSMGLFSIFLGCLTLITVAYRKLFLGVFVHRDPLFLITIFLVLSGVQLVVMGLIAELQVRTYFESQKKTIYDIKEIREF
jgi:glycosyltransferase involved in cell wall biosynthesis